MAEFTGYDVRSIRDFTDALETAKLLVLRRQRKPDGSERIHYAPGPALIVAVGDFIDHYPDDRVKPLRAEQETTDSPGR